MSLNNDNPHQMPESKTKTTETAAPNRRKIKHRKARKPSDIEPRRTPDATYVPAQDGTEIIFDPGDYETKVKPINPLLMCNLSGQGAIHVRIHGSIEPVKAKNNLQVSRLVLGLNPSDPREVFFINRNQRDMRKINLELRGNAPAVAEGEDDKET